MTLDDAFEQFMEIAFPEFAESDELSDWQAELAELDGHIAGIATAILAGGRPDSSALPKCIAEMRLRLQSMRSVPAEDHEVFAHCRNYLDAMDRVVQSMKD